MQAMGLLLKVGTTNIPHHGTLISLCEISMFRAKGIMQLKEAMKQLGLSAASGVSSPTPYSSRLAMTGESTEHILLLLEFKGMNTH